MRKYLFAVLCFAAQAAIILFLTKNILIVSGPSHGIGITIL